MAEAPQRTEREERVDRLLLLAERLRQRDRPSRGRTLLEEALRLSPDDPRALRALVQDGHRRAPAGEEAPGLREVAGRPGAWRARSLLAVEQVPPGSDGDSSLCRAWLDSALEAAPAPHPNTGTDWDAAITHARSLQPGQAPALGHLARTPQRFPCTCAISLEMALCPRFGTEAGWGGSGGRCGAMAALLK